MHVLDFSFPWMMVNVVSWWLAKAYGWQFDWKCQWIIPVNVLLARLMAQEVAS